ncbi:2-C-methyl-D-erythritol 4-phosphate cytidylyltransferase [Colwellia sp. 39_35_sub15_T18]|nr:2-C-methyl-D-erythritol 4-phosphate cytidylyltransferase [Colwellia sp. 39_35_sub15_T18]
MVEAFNQQFIVVVPAAGVGKRMLAPCPKQYLKINDEAILVHTVNRLLSHKKVAKIILTLSDDDDYFAQTMLANNPDVVCVSGGKERVDSVLNGLCAVDETQFPWVLVHDAARPCVSHQDIDLLIEQCLSQNSGGLLAAQVVDTIKQSESPSTNSSAGSTAKVFSTIDRSCLWQALTPQMYKTIELKSAIEQALCHGIPITDESSAIELAGLPSLLVSSSRENIKITRPEDLALAAFYLNQQRKEEENRCA